MYLKLEIIRISNDVISTSCLCAEYGEYLPHKAVYTFDDYYSSTNFCQDILDKHNEILNQWYNSITPIEGKVCPEHGQMYYGRDEK